MAEIPVAIPAHRLSRPVQNGQEEVTVTTASYQGSVACKIGLLCLFVAGAIGFFVVYQT